jgi:hypothetical protein
MLSARCAALVAELQAMSPMPDDEILDRLPAEGHPLEKLDTILTLLKQETQAEYPFELISPLLQVFGVGDGNGVYWSLLHFIEKYPHREEIYPVIQQATRSANAGTRMWSCRLLGRRRQKEDEPFFLARLQDEEASVRQEALVGISMLAQRYDMKQLLSRVEPLLQDPTSSATS